MSSLASAGRRENEKNFLQNVREAWSCLLVAVCTMGCFLPSGVEIWAGKMIYFDEILRCWTSTTLLMVPVLNSLVFFWRNKIWRTEAKKNTL